jgi:hypothetical protein
MIEAQPLTDETLVERICLLDGGIRHFQAGPWRSHHTLHCEFARKFLCTNLGGEFARRRFTPPNLRVKQSNLFQHLPF